MKALGYIRSRVIVYIRLVLRKIYSRRLSRYSELTRLLDHFSDSQSAAIDVADAIALYEYIQQLKPRCILELGPGTSTNIIALAIEEVRRTERGYNPLFHSYEENPEWFEYHNHTLVPHLRDNVKIGLLRTSKKISSMGGGCLLC